MFLLGFLAILVYFWGEFVFSCEMLSALLPDEYDLHLVRIHFSFFFIYEKKKNKFLEQSFDFQKCKTEPFTLCLFGCSNVNKLEPFYFYAVTIIFLFFLRVLNEDNIRIFGNLSFLSK